VYEIRELVEEGRSEFLVVGQSENPNNTPLYPLNPIIEIT
jgi:hypothetical protein